MLLEERPLTTFHLHVGQKLVREIALSKTMTDPNLQFCLVKETAIKLYVDQKCTISFSLSFRRAPFERREMNKRN